jgi:hypothetical protein
MKKQLKVWAVVIAAVLLTGCASSGGRGGDGGRMDIDTAEEQILCMLVLFLCVFMSDLGSPAKDSASSADESSSIVPTVPFTKWSELPRGAQTEARSLTTGVFYKSNGNGQVESTSATPFAQGTESLLHDARGNLQYYGGRAFAATNTSLAAVGHSGLDVGQQEITNSGSLDIFPILILPSRSAAVTANPYVLGWEYQSFGVWDGAYPSRGEIHASSFGAPTPGSAVPTSGTATFSGKLGGFYVSPTGQAATAAADLSVNASFSSRSLHFTSRGTTLTRDARNGTAAPNLNLNGTLIYSPGSSAFSGTLTNSGGTMSGSSKGQFYGPTAQEVGGVFTVRSPTTVETFTGGYGAKR